MKIKSSLLLALSLLLSSWIFAQKATVRGFVYEKKNGEPMIFTPVYLQGTTHGAQTDVNGYFNINGLPEGAYTLVSTSLGYDTIKTEIQLKAGEVRSEKIFLSESSIQLKTVDISANKQEKQTEVRMSVTKITPKEMKQLPSVGGEPDLAQYLQVIPGIVFTGDQGGQLYIRGGTPVQNKLLLDGMIVYNPFHSIGFYSVLDVGTIRNADIYTGGFAANYGGRISSIMDITTRDGNKKRLSGVVGMNTFTAKAMLEGPLIKQKEDGKGLSSSFLLSAKQSYLATTSKKIYSFLDEFDPSYVDSSGLPFNFRDLYGKVSINGNTGSKINFFGYNYTDAVKYQSIANIDWSSYGIGSNFVLIPGSSNLMVKGNFAYSQYKINYDEFNGTPRYSGVKGFNAGIDASYYIGKNTLNYGLELIGLTTDFNYYNGLKRQIKQNENTSEFATFFKYKMVFGKLLLEPSIRGHYYASLSTFSPEPRIGAKYNITDNIRVKISGGKYSQNLVSSSNDRDVVNLFYGFLSGPQNLPSHKYPYNLDSTSYVYKSNRDSLPLKNALQKANHYIAGFEFDLARHLELQVEGYIKQFTQLANINRDKIYDDSPENYNKPDYQKKDFIVETGYAKGLDFLIKFEYKAFNFFAGYSIAKTQRFDGLRLYYPVFDRRHNVNLVSSYKFGKDETWEFDLRWNLGSGFPLTKTKGFYEKLTLQDGPTSNYTNTNGELGVLYGNIGEGRLPYYHRLDVALKKVYHISENSTLDINLSITNAYNRPNIFYFDRIRYKRVNQLPFLPSLGINFNF